MVVVVMNLGEDLQGRRNLAGRPQRPDFVQPQIAASGANANRRRGNKNRGASGCVQPPAAASWGFINEILGLREGILSLVGSHFPQPRRWKSTSAGTSDGRYLRSHRPTSQGLPADRRATDARSFLVFAACGRRSRLLPGSTEITIPGGVRMNRSLNGYVVGIAGAAILLLGIAATCRAAAEEPNYRTAAGWWKELPKKWTPVGWKNHLLRYDVLFNGAIVSKPDLNGRTTKWIDRGVFLLPSPANPVRRRHNGPRLAHRPRRPRAVERLECVVGRRRQGVATAGPPRGFRPHSGCGGREDGHRAAVCLG